MKIKLLLAPGIVVPVLLAFACASVGISDRSVPNDWPENEILAREMPEVAIAAPAQSWERVKIIRLVGRELTILPYPYWNVDAMKIDPEQVTTIQCIVKSKFTPLSAISTFNVVFGVSGLLGALFSKYKGEYQDALFNALKIGAFFGMCSLSIGILRNAHPHEKWDLTGMSVAQRLDVLLGIMGK